MIHIIICYKDGSYLGYGRKKLLNILAIVHLISKGWIENIKWRGTSYNHRWSKNNAKIDDQCPATFNIKNLKIFLTMSLSLDRNILGYPISLFLFLDTKWIHDICCLKLIYCVMSEPFWSIWISICLSRSLIISFF